jgi:RNA polymerase sigma factor (sigma-70 family)
MAHGGLDEMDCESDRTAIRIEKSSFLKSLVRDNHDSLIRYLRRRLGNNEDAADVAQDLYCQIARQPNVAAIRQPRAYLFQAARNLIFNRNQHRRYTNADAHISIEDATEFEMMCSSPSPERITQSRQELAVVERAIKELSPKCRTAFVLVRFEGRSYKEAAKQMELSVKSVEYYMRQAITHIRDRVDAVDADARQRQAAE